MGSEKGIDNPALDQTGMILIIAIREDFAFGDSDIRITKYCSYKLYNIIYNVI